MSDQPLIGSIQSFAGNFAPKGWYECNGQKVKIVNEQPLFSIVGLVYGGNGQESFNVPDLRPVVDGQKVDWAVAGQPRKYICAAGIYPRHP